MAKLRRRSAALAVALALGGLGCQDDGSIPISSSMKEVPVKGTVTINGKPATKGELTFHAANVRRREAPVHKTDIKPDGTFEISALVDTNSVAISGPDVAASKPPLGMRTIKSVEVKAGEDLKIEYP